jgi:tetratricopeptide (TPR) repeat protein
MSAPRPAQSSALTKSATFTVRPIVRLHLIGEMRATTYLGDDILPRGRKARALLACLCLSPRSTVLRANAVALLWNEVALDLARNSLRQALRELLSAFGPIASRLVTATRKRIVLKTDECWIDALALREEPSLVGKGELLSELNGTTTALDAWLRQQREHLVSSLTASHHVVDLKPITVVPGRRLRVAIPPLQGSDRRGKDDLGFSLAHEISAGLGRFRWFDAIGPVGLRRTPADGFTGHHELRGDIDYVVEGTVTGTGRCLHIVVRLLDLAESVRQLWSGSFDIQVNDLHQLTEVVTVPIVARIDPAILQIEGQPKRKRRYGATGLLLRAIPMFFSMQRPKYEKAGRLITRALGLEPDSAIPEAWAAQWHLFHVGQGWTNDWEASMRKAQKHALRAIKLDPENAEALGIYAHCCSIIDKNFDAAVIYFDRALLLNPSLAFNWALSAATYCYIGKPEIALQRLERYRELAPPSFSWLESFYTVAYMFKGDYERAVLVGRRAVKSNPDFTSGYKPLIAALGHLGRCQEARTYVHKLCALEPAFTIEHHRKIYPFKREADRERYLAGLRLAGVPRR